MSEYPYSPQPPRVSADDIPASPTAAGNSGHLPPIPQPPEPIPGTGGTTAPQPIPPTPTGTGMQGHLPPNAPYGAVPPAQPPTAWTMPQTMPYVSAPQPAPPPDPNRPLWQAVIGPLTEAEWRLTRPRRQTVIGWAYALAALLCLYFGSTAFDFSPIPLFGLSVPRAALFLPLHALFVIVSFVAFIRNITAYLWCERDAWETTRLLESRGRLVTVYCDRITAQGEFDVITVPLSGAVVCEQPTLLTVSKDGQTVIVRGSDVRPERITALSALLVAAGAVRTGRFPTAGFPYPVAERTAPTLREPKLLFCAPFTLTVGDVFFARFFGFLRRQWLVWAPLMCLCAGTLTDILPVSKYYLLYYGMIILAVIAISLLIPMLALLWDAKTDRTLPKNGRWEFYPDRMLIVTDRETRHFPRQLAAMTDEGRCLTLRMLGAGESWPKSAFADYAAMAAFVGIAEKPAKTSRREKAE